jgi:hypothetical protein
VIAVIYAGAVWMVNLGRPDEQLCNRFFQKFSKEIFPVLELRPNGRYSRLNGRTSAVSNFLKRLCASRPWGMSVRTAKLQHAISISAMRTSGP